MNSLRCKTFLAAALCLGSMGCSPSGTPNSSGPNGNAINLTGDWLGTWTSDSQAGQSGPLNIHFEQSTTVYGGGSPSQLLGTAQLVGHPCSAPLVVDASIHPGGFVDPTHFSGTFTGQSITIQVFASVAGSASFVGTYDFLPGSACEGDTGSIQGSLASPLPPLSTPRPEVNQPQTIVHLYDNPEDNTFLVLIELVD